jgi:aspartate aminotransferase
MSSEAAAVTPTGPRVSERGRSIPGSPTMALDSRAKAMKAAGEAVINLTAGEPDLPPPEAAVAAAAQALARYAKYTPPEGLLSLRQAIVEATARETGASYAPDQVLVSTGAKQCLYNLIQVLTDPGDEVVVLAPYWVSYPDQVRLAGARPVVVETRPEDGWRPDPAAVRRAYTPRTRALILNAPNNPTGAVYPMPLLTQLVADAMARGITVVSDEIYASLTYGGLGRAPSAAQVPGVDPDLLVVVNGVSKSYAMTGYRIGWAVGPRPVIQAAARLQSQVTSCPAGPSQAAAEAALRGDQSSVEAMRRRFEARRELIVDGLARVGLPVAPPDGAFYVYVPCAPALGRPVAGAEAATSQELASLLLERVKVATVPGEAFGWPGYLRLSFAAGEEDLREAVRRLGEALA